MRYLAVMCAATAVLTSGPLPESLRSSVTLHASFDKGIDADVARGNRAIHNAPDYKQQASAKPGTGSVDVAIEKGVGIGGTPAIRFKSKNERALFYPGDKHLSLGAGSASFWLRLDPEKELAPGFCDPIQLTDKAYNDSALWVDFTKDEVPRHFRLGVFGELKAWNPKDTPPDKNPDFLNRLIVVQKHPFTSQRWTHVAITWSELGKGSGSASLFLDGKRVSTAKGIKEPFRWDPKLLAIRLGVNYVGLMDEVAIFDRALTDAEVAAVYKAGQTK